MTRHFQTSDGLTLAYDDQGSGPPVLCLAGLTRNRDDFDPVLPLANRVRLIRLDYRGRGASDHADWTTYTIPREAQDALELLDHLNLPRAAILGTSRGGLIAMLLALTHHDRLLGVFLNDIGPVIEPAGLDAIKGYVGLTPPYPDFHAAALGLQHALKDSFPNVPLAQWETFARRIYRQTPQGLDLRYDPALRQSVLSAATPTADLWPLFDALADLPTAVLRGANSNLLSPATVEEMTRRHPTLLTATVPNRGHVPFLDEPESQTLLDTWLAQLQ
ncbi:MAG: alpha/beta fold hydrolase [Paracoccaceae bacterium]